VLRIALAVVIATISTLVSAGATSAAEVLVAFRTPSGNIGCVYDGGGTSAPVLRCDIRTSLRPRPHRPRGCDLDWGDSYTLSTRGRAVLTCHGDTAILQHARVIAYGTAWARGGFVCASSSVGLRCRNRAGHGFFMSRQHSYRF
jgi:hypothetical protein